MNVSRLVDVFRTRAAHPSGIGYLSRFNKLSDREALIVSHLMECCAIELQHAYDEDEYRRSQKGRTVLEARQLMRVVGGAAN